ncbi:MAG: cupin domain-containing protein [Terracidiphilus sp.]
MHHLGSTRSSLKPDHLLQTPDTFIRSPLPGADGVEFIIHAAPALGARFTQMTAEFVAGGELAPAAAQRFVYVLDGRLEVKAAGKKHILKPGGFAYLPQGVPHTVRATGLRAPR